MKLWTINIRAEIKFGDPRTSDNTIILAALDKSEAETRAIPSRFTVATNSLKFCQIV